MKKILIVEDDEALGKVFCEKFEREGYLVQYAVSGDVVRSLVEHFLPDIILLDIILLNKNGLEVLAELKTSEGVKNIPVIMVSNLDGEREKSESKRLGAIDYLVKSQVPLHEIVKKVAIVVGRN